MNEKPVDVDPGEIDDDEDDNDEDPDDPDGASGEDAPVEVYEGDDEDDDL